MRAMQICLFLLCISVGISTVHALDIFPDVGPQGSAAGDVNPANPEAHEEGEPYENVPNITNFLSIGVLGGFIVSAIAARLLGADPLRVIGIGLFGGFFWGMWGTANSVLNWLNLGPIQAVILMVYAITFFVAIQELCTQASHMVYG